MAELGSSPVADYSNLSEVGLRFQERAQQRSAIAHQNLVKSYEESNQQLMQAKQQMMMLPPSVAAEFSINVENALNKRAESIMSGSSTAVDMSTGDFADMSISAAKVSAVYKDLVSKYERVRQSEQYAQNKEAYDEWYNLSTETIRVQSSQGLDGAAQLDFFQPPVLQPDTNIIEYGAQLFQTEFKPSQFYNQYSTDKGQGVKFEKGKAKAAATSFVADQYGDANGKMQADIDYLSVMNMKPEAKPEEVLADIARFKSLEDELTANGLTTAEAINAQQGVPASVKREQLQGLKFIQSRETVMDQTADAFVNSIAIDENFTAYRSTGGGGEDLGDYGMNKGVISQIQNISPDTIVAAGFKPDAKIGYSSNKSGTRKTYGAGSAMRYYDGLIYDGTGFKVLAYKPTPDFLQNVGSMTDEQIRAAVMDESKFTQVIEETKQLRGDIPAAQLSAMQQIAKQQYLDLVAEGNTGN